MPIDVDSLNPIAGWTGGKTYIEFSGSGFETPGTIRVFFDGEPADRVEVLADNQLGCLTPIHDPTDEPIDVRIELVDSNGNVVEGIDLPSSYRYLMPDLTIPSDLTRVVDVLVKELSRQVIPNVTWPKHVDYDEATGDELSEIDIAKLPALVISGVMLRESPNERDTETIYTTDPNNPTNSMAHAPADRVDMQFTLVGASDNSGELINLYSAVRTFFRRNLHLRIPRAADPASGTIDLPIFHSFLEPSALNITSNKDNLRNFGLVARIEGIPLESMAGLEFGGPGTPEWADYEGTQGRTATLDEVQFETVRRRP